MCGRARAREREREHEPLHRPPHRPPQVSAPLWAPPTRADVRCALLWRGFSSCTRSAAAAHRAPPQLPRMRARGAYLGDTEELVKVGLGALLRHVVHLGSRLAGWGAPCKPVEAFVDSVAFDEFAQTFIPKTFRVVSLREFSRPESSSRGGPLAGSSVGGTVERVRMGEATAGDSGGEGQGGSHSVQVVCARSGQLLATASLPTPCSWDEARRMLVGAVRRGDEALDFRFSYVTASLALSSESSWALCTALWQSKGARAARTLTVEPSAANGGDHAAENAGTTAHAAGADRAAPSPHQGAPQAPAPEGSWPRDRDEAPCASTLLASPSPLGKRVEPPSTPPVCPAADSICSPLSRLGDFGYLFERHVSFDADVAGGVQHQAAPAKLVGLKPLPSGQGDVQSTSRCSTGSVPPPTLSAVTAVPASPATEHMPPPTPLDRLVDAAGDGDQEGLAAIQVSCSDLATGEKLAIKISFGAADPFEEMRTALSRAIEAGVARRVASLHFASPSGGIFDLDSESSWKLCKGLAAASGHPTALQLLVTCGECESDSVKRDSIEAKDESVRLASEQICREMRQTPWYTQLEREMQKSGITSAQARLLEQQYRCVHSQRQHFQQQQPPPAAQLLPPEATGSSVAPDLPAEEMQRLEDIRAQMRRMTGALGPSGARDRALLQPLPRSRKPFQPRQEGDDMHGTQVKGAPGSGEKPHWSSGVTPDLPAEEMQRLEDIRAQMRRMINSLG